MPPPPILSFGIIVPAERGIKISGPFSPTSEALPTGGLPPFAKPRRPISKLVLNALGKLENELLFFPPPNIPPKALPKKLPIPETARCIATSTSFLFKLFKTPVAASAKVFVPITASVRPETIPSSMP